MDESTIKTPSGRKIKLLKDSRKVKQVSRGLSKEKVEKMKEMRKEGASYREIESALDVSRWSCQKYLQDIEVDESYIEKKWKEAQNQAREVLQERDFENILDLNKITSDAHWDYYCTKKGKRWLIDVTINQEKNLVDKALRRVEGFKHGILLREDGSWKMLRIDVSEIEIDRN